jgi:lysozyme family protein
MAGADVMGLARKVIDAAFNHVWVFLLALMLVLWLPCSATACDDFLYDQDFLDAQAFVLRIEGAPSNDKYDKGGYTKFGVSQRFLRTVKNHAKRYNVQDITFMEAMDILYENFWLVCRCDKLPKGLDLVVYDTAVHCGMLRAINYLRKGLGMPPTGKMTDAVIAHACWANVDDVVDAIIKERTILYHNKVRADPRQRKFLKGWLIRLDKLKEASKYRNI